MKNLKIKKFNILCFLLIGLTAFSLSVATAAQEVNDVNIVEFPKLPEEPRMPGVIEDTGTYFEVNNSDYLNIKLESSEKVHLRLESLPKMIVIDIEAAEGATSTVITLTGFEPSTIYYKYQDDYHNLVTFAADPNGRFTYVQDLTEPHLVFIQPNASTKFIPYDTTIGTWDPVNRIYTLTTDVSETIQISEDNLTLNGAGHTVTGEGTGFGIYLNGREGVSIQNLNVQTFTYGIVLIVSSNNNVLDVTAQDAHIGFHVSNSHYNHIENCKGYNNRYCIIIIYGSFNSVTNSEVHNNRHSGIYLDNGASSNTLMGNNIHHNGIEQYSYGIYLRGAGTNNIFRSNTLSQNKYNFHVYGYTFELWDQDIDTSNLVEGKPILYLKNPSNYVLENTDAYGVIYIVRGDNIRLSNLTFAQNNYANITFIETNNSKIENMNIYGQGLFGIYLIACSNNMISYNSISEHIFGLLIRFGSENTLTNNSYYNNSSCIAISYSLSNIIKSNNFSYNNSCIGIGFSEQNIICDNVIDGGNGISVSGSTSNRIERNSIHNAGWGITLGGGSLNLVSDNTIGHSDNGIVLGSKAINNTVTGNEIYNCLYNGILLFSVNESNPIEGNLISSNNIYNNNNNGIGPMGWGLIKNNTIISNNIYNNSGPAIFLARRGVENKIINNTISGNLYGVLLRLSSDNNQIYNNNFINNQIQAIVGESSGNLFNLDRPIGGNYWDDWTSPDNDSDGFVDFPYVFTGGVDNLPWTHQDGWGPAAAITRIINQVSDLNLQNGIDNSLDAKLEAAVQALDDINQNNDVAAINALQAFINAVEAQRGNKISEADADALISAAQEIIAMLSGT